MEVTELTNSKIGVYICHCGTNIAGKVDIEKVREYASKLGNVATAKDYMFMCSEPGQEMISEDIRRLKLDGIVVAACTETLHGHTFRSAAEKGGLNPYKMQMASIREYDSWVTKDPSEATSKAEDMIRGAVSRVENHEDIETTTYPVTENALVVGAGIAGISAATVLADAGKQVYLVEKDGFIGGNMAKFDKTFPTLDCASCILTPKMSAIKGHPNIHLFSYSEVKEVEGFVGNFKAKIVKNPRYVIEDKCVGCLDCVTECVYKEARFESEFDEGIGKRKPIYVSFPQAIPLVPVIDPETCLQLKVGNCLQTCVKACPKDAIDFSMKEEEVEVDVGGIITATGFKTFDAKRQTEYGFGNYPNVYTNIQVERMLNAAGPTGGEILLSDGKKPKNVAIINCVGSRDDNYNAYCSRLCCMTTIKQAHLIKEKTDANVTVYYIDIRANGKNYEEFYKRVQSEGVDFIRGKVSSILPSETEGNLSLMVEDTLLGKVRNAEADMVVLAVALEPKDDWEEVRHTMNLVCTKEGWFIERHPKLAPVSTITEGVYLAGTCHFPKDIPDTVAHAEAAAGELLSLINKGFVESVPNVISIDEEKCSGCHTCIAMCPYNALAYSEDKKVAEVNVGLCKGCGACAAVCPSAAISQNLYTDQELYSEIGGVI